MFMNVDLPLPLAPMMATNSLRRISVVTPRSACTFCSPISYVLWTSMIWMTGESPTARPAASLIPGSMTVAMACSLASAWCSAGSARCPTAGAAGCARGLRSAGDELVAFVQLAVQDLSHGGHGVVGDAGADLDGGNGFIRQQLPDDGHVEPALAR